MPDSQISEGVEPVSLIEKAYTATNYFAMKLRIDINNGRRSDQLRPTFEELRYGFMGLYDLVGHRPDFDAALKKNIEYWAKIPTKKNKTVRFYLQSLQLYEKFKTHLVFLQEIQ